MWLVASLWLYYCLKLCMSMFLLMLEILHLVLFLDSDERVTYIIFTNLQIYWVIFFFFFNHAGNAYHFYFWRHSCLGRCKNIVIEDWISSAMCTSLWRGDVCWNFLLLFIYCRQHIGNLPKICICLIANTLSSTFIWLDQWNMWNVS